MRIESIRAKFLIQAGFIRKSVLIGAMTVEEGKAKLHEALDDIIDDNGEELADNFKKAAQISAKRDINRTLGDDE